MGGRIIRENDCLILHIFPMDDGETREEVPMNVMIHQPAEREARLMQANREELVERIARAMREDGIAQPLQGLYLYRGRPRIRAKIYQRSLVRLLKVIQGHAFRSPSHSPRLELGCLLGAAALLIRLVLQGPQGAQ